ncbi:heme peroxidase [Hygrophoropsis aurantiaca]|uniref:Heme peroxidase n=1 Tax=Hygrophoropsis aurantiaca TaxID=72124 RepID=A0ACB8ANN2_9AGAM|nr:heme peroxidase [Hygrophoropsis aurantiaca]
MSTLNRSFSSRFSTKSAAPNGSASTSDFTQPQSQPTDSGLSKALAHVKDLMKRAAEDINESTISAALDAVRHADAIDDRKMLLENLLNFMAHHPTGKIQDMSQNFVIKELYNDLSHPPATYIGKEYAFRTADGSNNNPDVPDMGKAGLPYSRSVQQGNAMPKDQMPDAGLVFDTLLKRDQFRPHPAGLSSLMFSFAALVIHSVFRTDHSNVNINLTSSYVDLAPLYGNDQKTQDEVRIKNGRGMLHPDAFAEDRLLLLPPASCALLVLFNRNHNYIAQRILEINERGTWERNPESLPENSPKRINQEDEIFNIARLCNCAWFAAVVFSDYFSAILGLVRQGSSWSLEPFGEFREDHKLFERGQGNSVSVEFNCLYRWHATTSVEDAEWINAQLQALFPDKNVEDLSKRDFYMKLRDMIKSEPKMSQWQFGNLNRKADDSFDDKQLAGIIQNATSHHAAQFGARGTPACMRLHEIMGIEANREWGVCSLNDFRKFLGLKTYSTFLEWNPNPEIADAAEKLYGHIDNLELYVGLQAEETKPVIEGAGLCPGYTISRAILSDAIALTRGDRFYTHDFTPYNMTAWGFADCQRDPDGYGFGSTLGRLFLRTLPDQFDKDSVYTWFPLMHPSAMKTNLTKLHKINGYSLELPKSTNQPITKVDGYVEVGEVLKNDKFEAEYIGRAKEVIKGKGFFIASENGPKEQSELLNILTPSPEAIGKIEKYFFNKTKELINSYSFSLVGDKTRAVNIVRDVLKFVPIHWAASEIGGIPLKTKQHPHGIYTEQELFDILGEIYQFVFLEVETAKYMILREKVKAHVEQLTSHIKSGLGGAGNRMSIAGFVGTISSMFGAKKKGTHSELVKRLFEIGHSTDKVVNSILALMVGSTVEMSIALTNSLYSLLQAEEDATFRTQAMSLDVKDQLGMEAFVIEALRLNPTFTGVYRVAKEDTTVGSLTVKQGERLFLNIASASKNEDVFPNPEVLDATRGPRERYLRGDIAFKVLGEAVAPKIIVQALRAVLSYDNVRRGPNQSGKLNFFSDASAPQYTRAYLNQKMFVTPWPTSLIIQYDVPASSPTTA